MSSALPLRRAIKSTALLMMHLQTSGAPLRAGIIVDKSPRRVCARAAPHPGHTAMSAVETVAVSPRMSSESLRGGLLWLMGFAGAFVFIEPSPYEIVAILAGLLFMLMGLSLC
jgi:hypothetical protein